MKKLLIIIVTLSCLIICTSCNKSIDTSDCIRIHIRADSNNEIDQDIKLVVRDEIINYLSNKLINLSSKEDAKVVITAELSNIKAIADNVLKTNGFQYVASVSLKQEEFPYRTYNGISFESGVYDALIINLGSGLGNNWWCVCFPPLCFEEDEDFHYKSRIKEWIND